MISRRALVGGSGLIIFAPAVSGCTTISLLGSVGRSGPVESAIFTEEALAPVNTFRATSGLEPLAAGRALSGIARERARAMARRGRLNHDGVKRLIETAGVGLPAAENIATGQPDTDAVIVAWSKSAGHRRNMLGEYRQFGLGYARVEGGRPYWSMVLAN
jgi:uncharacterized protein YkwD